MYQIILIFNQFVSIRTLAANEINSMVLNSAITVGMSIQVCVFQYNFT